MKKEGIAFDLFEKKRIGGLLWYASRVDNLLGHRGKNGKVLCHAFTDHMEAFGIEIRKEKVTELDILENGFTVNGNDYSHVVLATGTYPRKLGIEGELCFIEDVSNFEGRDVLVVGGGDLAFDNALNLQESRANVTIVHRGTVKANRKLVDEVKEAGIEIIKDDPGSIAGIGDGYEFRDRTYHILAVFIGRSPKLDLLEGLEHFKSYLPSFRTSVKGLYVIGDAALGTLSQTALASGSGLAAAMDIGRMVKEDETALQEGT